MKLSLPQMAQLLMQVGDIVPYRRRPQRGEVPGIPEVGPMGRGVGASQWRTPEGVAAYEAQSGLRPGTLAPVNPNRGDVIPALRMGQDRVMKEILAGKPTTAMPTRDPNARSRDMSLVQQQWHANTPAMARALQKLTPNEINALFDRMFPK
jgi:hypothetical protein